MAQVASCNFALLPNKFHLTEASVWAAAVTVSQSGYSFSLLAGHTGSLTSPFLVDRAAVPRETVEMAN